MPTFLDSHAIGSMEEEAIRQAQKAPKDEYGITHKNIYFNKEEDRCFCLLDAPSKDAIEKHHQNLGMKCDWIVEVKSAA
ncbi:MAG TPA: nickel-binding protein [Nitrososphaera sp.]